MNDTETLASHLEALLFAMGRPVSRSELAKKLTATDDQLEEAIVALNNRLTHGITLVDDGHTIELRTSAVAANIIEQIQKEENSRDIGKAGLEALAAILYRGPLTRADIDFIRGVNSSQTLRTLTMRGLIRRVENPKDQGGRQGSFIYELTTELLAYLGIATRAQVPEYDSVRQKLELLEQAYRQKESQE
jgi:segregation and condensation protein B